jgi:GNAT superfamily N-acetyltransferase
LKIDLRMETMILSGIEVVQVMSVSEHYHSPAVDLLERFFREEGFATPRRRIAENLRGMLAEDTCWAAIAMQEGGPLGIVTVTTMLYVEWGRLAEISDLYVAPEYRGQGVARRLVGAAIDWSNARGCTGAYVTLTPDGEARHRLSLFYKRLSFRPTGTTTMMLARSH